MNYLFRGRFTETCPEHPVRRHLNPWINVVDGHNDDEPRSCLWGTALGFDYRLSDDLNFIADYQYNRGHDEGDSDDWHVEVEPDWSITEGRMIGLSVTFGVDGDNSDTDYGGAISYIIEDAHRAWTAGSSAIG